VLVVEVSVALSRALGEAGSVGLGPGVCHVLCEGDAPAVQGRQGSELLAPAEVGGEIRGITLAVERSSPVAPAVAPADPPSERAVT
jgi:hypothetical protein